jgi:DNA-binding IclR family transcriptional regulator
MLAFSTDRNTLTARDLAAATGIALPSVYRYITLLRETGLLAGDERGSYRLSARLIGLARAAEAAESIIDIADPVMRDLAAQTGETVILVRLIGRSAVCVHRVQSAQRLRISFEAGQPLPLERGASARMLLSGLTPEQRREYLAPLAEGDPEAAARFEIRAVQAGKQGYATSEEELEQGVFAVSAPVFQGKRMIAVITVPSPLVRAPAPLQEKLLRQVRAAAQDLNEALRVTRYPRAPYNAGVAPLSFRNAGLPRDDPGHARQSRVAGRAAGRDDRRRADLRRADQLLSAAHRPLEPRAARGHHGQPQRRARGGGQRRGPRAQWAARPARRHPRPGQGQRPGQRDADHRRLARAPVRGTA